MTAAARTRTAGATIVVAGLAAALAGLAAAAPVGEAPACHRAPAAQLLVCPAADAPGAVVLDDAALPADPAPPAVASRAPSVTLTPPFARAPVLPIVVTVPPVVRKPLSRPVVSRGVAPKTWKAPVVPRRRAAR